MGCSSPILARRTWIGGDVRDVRRRVLGMQALSSKIFNPSPDAELVNANQQLSSSLCLPTPLRPPPHYQLRRHLRQSRCQLRFPERPLHRNQRMGVSYRVSARYVSRYIFCIFSLYLGTMYLYRKSIDRNASLIRYFFYFTLHAFSITVKGKGFNYLSVKIMVIWLFFKNH